VSCFPIFSCAQFLIFGSVKDKSNQPVASATVILKSKYPKEGIVAYTITDDKGLYSLKNSFPGKYIIYFSSISYKTKVDSLEITIANSTYEKNTILPFDSNKLDEVIVNSARPIVIKNDTIVFLAKSFVQGNEKVVEDLLKRIPGINISSDGSIKIGNKEVEKVMIEGDDFFQKGYRILTKNMPSFPIEKVEVLQHFSNNKLLKGIEKSDRVAINLTLIDSFKRKWFGNFSLASNFSKDSRHSANTNLMNFGKKSKYYVLFNTNNTSDDVSGDIKFLIHPTNPDASESLGDKESINNLLEIVNQYPDFNKNKILFNNDFIFSLNSINSLSDKSKIKISGTLNSTSNNEFKSKSQSILIDSFYQNNFQSDNIVKKQFSGNASINYSSDISKNRSIEFLTKFNKLDNKDRNELDFNGSLFKELINGSGLLFDEKLTYTDKYKKAGVLVFTVRHMYERKNQDYYTNYSMYNDLFSTFPSFNNQMQSATNSMQFASFDARIFDRKKNNSLIELRFGNQFIENKLFSSLVLKDKDSIIGAPEKYQNNLKYSVNDLFFSGKIVFAKKNISLMSKLDIHQLSNLIESPQGSQKQAPFYVNPNFGLDWQLNIKNKIAFSYSFNTSNVGVVEVSNQFINSSLQVFSKGFGTFNQLDASSVILNYTYGGWADKFFANSFLLYTKNYSFLSTNTLVTKNYTQSENILVKDRSYFMFQSNIDRFIKPISSNIKMNIELSHYSYKNQINSMPLRDVKTFIVKYGIEMRSAFKGFFNYNLGTKWSSFSIQTSVYSKYINNLSFIDLDFIFNDKLNVSIRSEAYYFGGMDYRANKYYFMDIDANYTLKKNGIIFSLVLKNIFNTKTFRNYSVNDISTSLEEYTLMPRFFLLKASIRF
jgi:hypothetical protein